MPHRLVGGSEQRLGLPCRARVVSLEGTTRDHDERREAAEGEGGASGEPRCEDDEQHHEWCELQHRAHLREGSVRDALLHIAHMGGERGELLDDTAWDVPHHDRAVVEHATRLRRECRRAPRAGAPRRPHRRRAPPPSPPSHRRRAWRAPRSARRSLARAWDRRVRDPEAAGWIERPSGPRPRPANARGLRPRPPAAHGRKRASESQRRWRNQVTAAPEPLAPYARTRMRTSRRCAYIWFQPERKLQSFSCAAGSPHGRAELGTLTVRHVDGRLDLSEPPSHVSLALPPRSDAETHELSNLALPSRTALVF